MEFKESAFDRTWQLAIFYGRKSSIWGRMTRVVVFRALGPVGRGCTRSHFNRAASVFFFNS